MEFVIFIGMEFLIWRYCDEVRDNEVLGWFRNVVCACSALYYVLYCVVPCGAVWCSVVRCGAVWCSVVQCGAVWCSVDGDDGDGVVRRHAPFLHLLEQCGAAWCRVVPYGAVWCSAVWCGVLPYVSIFALVRMSSA
jgi:hypothetical protein